MSFSWFRALREQENAAEAAGPPHDGTATGRASAIAKVRANEVSKQVAGKLARMISDKDGLSEIGAMFTQFDEDNSGSLDPKEFNKGLQEFGITLLEKEFSALMKMVDLDGNGTIELHEFESFINAELELTLIDAHLATVNAASQSAMIEAAHRGCSFTTDDSTTRRPSVKMQGDADMLSSAALAERKSLKHNPKIIHRIQEWWGALRSLGGKQKDGRQYLLADGLSKAQFMILMRSLTKTLQDEQGEQDEQDDGVDDDDGELEQDWINDKTKGEEYMDSDSFFESIFELCDLWADTVDVNEYLSLLDRLAGSSVCAETNELTRRGLVVHQARVSTNSEDEDEDEAPAFDIENMLSVRIIGGSHAGQSGKLVSTVGEFERETRYSVVLAGSNEVLEIKGKYLRDPSGRIQLSASSFRDKKFKPSARKIAAKASTTVSILSGGNIIGAARTGTVDGTFETFKADREYQVLLSSSKHTITVKGRHLALYDPTKPRHKVCQFSPIQTARSVDRSMSMSDLNSKSVPASVRHLRNIQAKGGAGESTPPKSSPNGRSRLSQRSHSLTAVTRSILPQMSRRRGSMQSESRPMQNSARSRTNSCENARSTFLVLQAAAAARQSSAVPVKISNARQPSQLTPSSELNLSPPAHCCTSPLPRLSPSPPTSVAKGRR
jgi:hypothetical protein